NEINHAHTFTVTFTQVPDGATAATTVSITPTVTPAPSSLSTTCGASVPFVGNVATCTVTINSTATGTFTANATGVVTISGATLTRATGDAHAGDSAPAVKTYFGTAIIVTEVHLGNDIPDDSASPTIVTAPIPLGSVVHDKAI